MSTRKELDLQQKTICRLIRENESLYYDLRNVKENARLHAAKILREAIKIIEHEDNKQLTDLYAEYVRGNRSGSTNRSRYSSRDDNNRSRPELRDVRESQLLTPSRLANRGVGFGTNQPGGSLNQSESRGVREESGFTSGLEDSSLHQSMLRSPLANSTSKWETQSSNGNHTLAKNLFPEERLRQQDAAAREDSATGIRRQVSIAKNEITVHEYENNGDQSSQTITKTTIGENGRIEVARMQSPGKSEDGIKNITTLGTNQFKSTGASSPLIQSPINEPSSLGEPVRLGPQRRKIDTPSADSHYSVWEIPNDNFHKVHKTPFYGRPVDTSTPIRRPDEIQTRFSGPTVLPKADISTQQSPKIAYTSSQLIEQHLTNGSSFKDSTSSQSNTKAREEAISPVGGKQSQNSTASTGANQEEPENINLQKILQNIQLSKRLLGEIAFQLDRRIINYVFSAKHDKRQRKRLYGYCVQNIQSMIRRHAVDHTTGEIDAAKLHNLERRYKYILVMLQPLGYNIEKHGDFSMDMVNKYGLLPLRPGPSSASTLNPTDNSSLHQLVASLSAPHEVKDMTILVDSLALLAREDGKPMIHW